jgi:GMP synthase (glutamine-hydrolysing)
MHIHCFQHVPFETPGNIRGWAGRNGHPITYTHFYQPDPSFDGLGDAGLLLILGGAMNADEEDRFAWLVREKEHIRRFAEGGKKVLGICLGSQLIVSALGGRVYAAPEREIGFFPVHFNAEAARHPWFASFATPAPFFHWHGDTFDLPPGAERLAWSEGCANQAFRIGDRVVGIQFHPEADHETLADMLRYDGHELAEAGPFIQSPQTILAQAARHLDRTAPSFLAFLDRFCAED